MELRLAHSEDVTDSHAPASNTASNSRFAAFASRAPWRHLPHPLRLLVATVLGASSLVLGTVLLVLPGPGLVFLALGLAILATEFAWAHTLLHRATNTGRQGLHKARALVGRPTTRNPT